MPSRRRSVRAAAKAKREERAAQRAAALEALREAEEDNRDSQDAAIRLRSKWEVAKKKAEAGNADALDNY